MDRPILIVGASGMLGSRVARMLLARGARVRAAGRRLDKLAGLVESGAQAVTLDLARPDSFPDALAGVGAVFTAAHGLMDRSGHGPERLDADAMCRMIDAAAEAGVRRFVHTSAQDAAPDSPAAFTRAKFAAEQHLRASTLEWTILRPSAFADLYGQAMIGNRVAAGRTVWLIGPGTTRRNLVAVDDVATIAVRALLEDRFIREIIEVTGPDNLTEREIAALYGQITGQRVQVRNLPGGLVRVLSRALQPIHGGPGSLIAFLTAQNGRDDLCSDVGAMAERLGRPSIALQALAREALSTSAP